MNQLQCNSCNKIFSLFDFPTKNHNCGKGRKRKDWTLSKQNLSSNFFKPRGISLKDLKIIKLSPNELEAIKLKDIENMHQSMIAKKMSVSQSTLARTLSQGRKKVALALLNGYCIQLDSNN